MIYSKRPSGNARALFVIIRSMSYFTTFTAVSLFLHIAEQYVIDSCDIGAGDIAIVINVAVYEVA